MTLTHKELKAFVAARAKEAGSADSIEAGADEKTLADADEITKKFKSRGEFKTRGGYRVVRCTRQVVAEARRDGKIMKKDIFFLV